jgi:hypothetical protein
MNACKEIQISLTIENRYDGVLFLGKTQVKLVLIS